MNYVFGLYFVLLGIFNNFKSPYISTVKFLVLLNPIIHFKNTCKILPEEILCISYMIVDIFRFILCHWIHPHNMYFIHSCQVFPIFNWNIYRLNTIYSRTVCYSPVSITSISVSTDDEMLPIAKFKIDQLFTKFHYQCTYCNFTWIQQWTLSFVLIFESLINIACNITYDFQIKYMNFKLSIW